MELLIYPACIFFLFYLVNHASLFDTVRVATMPALPSWLRKSLTCSFCFAFWVASAISLFYGFTPLNLAVPVFVLFIELVYQKLIR